MICLDSTPINKQEATYPLGPIVISLNGSGFDTRKAANKDDNFSAQGQGAGVCWSSDFIGTYFFFGKKYPVC